MACRRAQRAAVIAAPGVAVRRDGRAWRASSSGAKDTLRGGTVVAGTLTVLGNDVTFPDAPAGTLEVLLAASAASFMATFFVAPRFKQSFKGAHAITCLGDLGLKRHRLSTVAPAEPNLPPLDPLALAGQRRTIGTASTQR